ncbi:hypothetical protein EWB00_002035, partial [Schistosoma japonicum]
VLPNPDEFSLPSSAEQWELQGVVRTLSPSLTSPCSMACPYLISRLSSVRWGLDFPSAFL